MKEILAILAIPALVGCSAMMPELFKAVDDAMTDTAISVEVDRAAILKETNVRVTVDVVNNDKAQ